MIKEGSEPIEERGVRDPGDRERRVVVVGSFAGVALSVFFACMWALAAFVDNSWTLGKDTLSELGGDVPSKWIFNSAVIVSGCLELLFSAGFRIWLRRFQTGAVGCFVLAFSAICLIAVGAFPIDTGMPHGVASVLFFATAALAAFFLIRPIHRWVGSKGVPLLVTVAVLAASLACLFLTPLPLAEAIAVICLLTWQLVLGSWIIREVLR